MHSLTLPQASWKSQRTEPQTKGRTNSKLDGMEASGNSGLILMSTLSKYLMDTIPETCRHVKPACLLIAAYPYNIKYFINIACDPAGVQHTVPVDVSQICCCDVSRKPWQEHPGTWQYGGERRDHRSLVQAS